MRHVNVAKCLLSPGHGQRDLPCAMQAAMHRPTTRTTTMPRLAMLRHADTGMPAQPATAVAASGRGRTHPSHCQDTPTAIAIRKLKGTESIFGPWQRGRGCNQRRKIMHRGAQRWFILGLAL